MKKIRFLPYIAVLIVSFSLAVSGCEDQSPLEDAADDTTDAVEDAGDEIEDATD